MREVAPHGARLHAIVDDARLRGPQIVAALAAAGVTEARAERIDPSLEDVFVSLVEGAGGADRRASWALMAEVRVQSPSVPLCERGRRTHGHSCSPLAKGD